jgi:hypothetical protein
LHVRSWSVRAARTAARRPPSSGYVLP